MAFSIATMEFTGVQNLLHTDLISLATAAGGTESSPPTFVTFIPLMVIIWAVMYFMVSRAPTVSSNSVLSLRLPGGLSERQANPLLTSFSGDVPTIRSVVDSLRKAKVDSRIRGVILLPSGPQPLWGKAQEIRDAVLDYRESGKPIVAFLEFGGR